MLKQPKIILRQANFSHVESMAAMQHAVTNDASLKTACLADLDAHKDILQEGVALPVGSVEFVRQAMALASINEPENLSYPEVLRPFLHRNMGMQRAGLVLGRWFVKPAKTKAFTGFLFDTLSNPDSLSDHDREQYNAFMAMPPEAPVWISEPVVWLSEFRFYIADGQIKGWGRYDDGPDDTPPLDHGKIEYMAEVMTGSPGAPAAFSLDVGVLDSGETALVECNDAWALGLYRGTLSRKDYTEMLWRRWQQLLQAKI